MGLGGVILVLALSAADPRPARALPVHRLDESQAGTTLVIEAGDRIVVRLREPRGAAWRPIAPPAAPLVALAAPPGAPGMRDFAYQSRGAGEAVLAFARPGSATILRFRIVAR